jgi:CelD/BcsL family acetyltransferase involved in cellulose biosynthesis
MGGVPAAEALQLDLDDVRWRAFTAACPSASPFHHPVWARVLADTYGYPGFAVALADADGRLLAGAPFLDITTLTRKRRWISLPFTDECPLLADDPLSTGRLLAALQGAHPGAAAPRIEVRGAALEPGWRASAPAVTHTLELDGDPAIVRRRFSRSQVLRSIRRAERENLAVRVASSANELDAFWALHLRTRRRQGVPVQPRRFFDLLWARMIEPGLGSILLTYAGKTPVAAALFLTWNGTTIYKFGASDPEAWPLRPNHLLFWTAIQQSCERRDTLFDFGRTDLTNDGLRAFKNSWGAIERPLVYSTWASGDDGGGEGVVGRVLAAGIRRGPRWVCRGAGEMLYRYAAAR